MALSRERVRGARNYKQWTAQKDMRKQTTRKRRQADRAAIAHERYDSIPSRYPIRGWVD